MTYPSGRQVSYSFDASGRVQGITTSKGGAAHTVLSNVGYRPFGPVLGYTLGNNHTYTRGFDQDGRIASYTLGAQSFAVGFDPASRITLLSETGNPPNTNSYSYDSLDRLLGFTGPTVNQSFTYDSVGNRLTKTVGAATDTYSYGPTSNRLNQITGGMNRTYTHDSNGSITGDSVNSFAYDTRGRLAQATSAIGTSNYQVNSLGQRIRKTNSQGDTVYHYDAQGRLIAESTPAGQVQTEYIYLGDIPVALFR
jgi:YD repeat-containing protein